MFSCITFDDTHAGHTIEGSRGGGTGHILGLTPRGDIPVPNVASRPHRPHFFRPKKYTPKKGHISRPHRPHFFAKKVNCKPDFAILAKIMWPQVAQAT